MVQEVFAWLLLLATPCLTEFLVDQLGAEIEGEAAGDSAGYSVSLSADGTRVAVGAIGADGATGFDFGRVRIYAFDGADWSPIGGDIEGEAADDAFGSSVSLSADGTRVAVGAIGGDGTGGYDVGLVRIYNLSDTLVGLRWSQIGGDIEGAAAYDAAGSSVSLSADGTRVAVGAPQNDARGASNTGHVRVYAIVGTDWSPIGGDIEGEAAEDQAGSSVSLSADGTRVAVGAPFNDGTGGSHSGHVRVYEFNGTDWSQIGEIDGQAVGENAGSSVSLSADGTRVAFGAPKNDAGGDSNTGHVRVYAFDGADWYQAGGDIEGEAAEDQAGSSVSLSADGTRVAVGAPFNDGTAGSDTGHVRIYEFNEATWSQIGLDIEGQAADDFAGFSVSLSADGTRVVVGAHDDTGGSGSDAGHVRIYELRSSTTTTSSTTAIVTTTATTATATTTTASRTATTSTTSVTKSATASTTSMSTTSTTSTATTKAPTTTATTATTTRTTTTTASATTSTTTASSTTVTTITSTSTATTATTTSSTTATSTSTSVAMQVLPWCRMPCDGPRNHKLACEGAPCTDLQAHELWECALRGELCELREPDCQVESLVEADMCANFSTPEGCEDDIIGCRWIDPKHEAKWTCRARQGSGATIAGECQRIETQGSCAQEQACEWIVELIYIIGPCNQGTWLPCRGKPGLPSDLEPGCEAELSSNGCESSTFCQWVKEDEQCRCPSSHFGSLCEHPKEIWVTAPECQAQRNLSGFDFEFCRGIPIASAVSKDLIECQDVEGCQKWHEIRDTIAIVFYASVLDSGSNMMSLMSAIVILAATRHYRFAGGATKCMVTFLLFLNVMLFLVDVGMEAMVIHATEETESVLASFTDARCVSQGEGYEQLVELENEVDDIRKASIGMMGLAVIGILVQASEISAVRMKLEDSVQFRLGELGSVLLALAEFSCSIYDLVRNQWELVIGLEGMEKAALNEVPLEDGFVCALRNGDLEAIESTPIVDRRALLFFGIVPCVSLILVSLGACCTLCIAGDRGADDEDEEQQKGGHAGQAVADRENNLEDHQDEEQQKGGHAGQAVADRENNLEDHQDEEQQKGGHAGQAVADRENNLEDHQVEEQQKGGHAGQAVADRENNLEDVEKCIVSGDDGGDSQQERGPLRDAAGGLAEIEIETQDDTSGDDRGPWTPVYTSRAAAGGGIKLADSLAETQGDIRGGGQPRHTAGGHAGAQGSIRGGGGIKQADSLAETQGDIRGGGQPRHTAGGHAGAQGSIRGGGGMTDRHAVAQGDIRGGGAQGDLRGGGQPRHTAGGIKQADSLAETQGDIRGGGQPRHTAGGHAGAQGSIRGGGGMTDRHAVAQGDIHGGGAQGDIRGGGQPRHAAGGHAGAQGSIRGGGERGIASRDRGDSPPGSGGRRRPPGHRVEQ